MVLIPVRCPQCHSDQVIKGGMTKAGKQRYRCQNSGINLGRDTVLTQ
jgi:transposase-like protein